ncbi:MAG: hypothetical protein A2908_01010 [Candidatus Staskawiczbacteria bacterium RIFCSPLOWO2_01_FULL_38_12b]|uniref:Uncharacterized protein n=1 Tax=Candidatus Staskawiczbacteria bacterium RIFCSPLOWO2_01_FULL_38_12b TaxID=1802214 RepID=A0A1G2IB50_9BACT|nr:MAG: hypothetical protein A2908_01010 [Candidatus Staskawiczbacteria bacterium RIFCSPLOWO2_01_FULL_38_12b]
MKIKIGSLVAVNFYDNRGDNSKKHAIGRVMGVSNEPPEGCEGVSFQVKIIHPNTWEEGEIGVLEKDLMPLWHLESAMDLSTWHLHEIILHLARKVDRLKQATARQ